MYWKLENYAYSQIEHTLKCTTRVCPLASCRGSLNISMYGMCKAKCNSATSVKPICLYMLQSRVETKHYSIAFFDCITTLKRYSAKLPLRAGSYVLGNSWILSTFTQRMWAPNSTEVVHYSTSNMVMQSRKRNRIIFDFYQGLPHMPSWLFKVQMYSKIHSVTVPTTTS